MSFAAAVMISGLLASCRPAPSDSVTVGTIDPEYYPQLDSWTMGELSDRGQKLWYKLDATGNPNDVFLHWQDEWYHEGVGPSEFFTLDAWLTIYDGDMNELRSEDNGWNALYDDVSNRNSGCLLPGNAIYYLEVEGYRDSLTGTFYFCAVQKGGGQWGIPPQF